MLVKITGYNHKDFSYGRYSKENKTFLEDNKDKTVKAERTCMNYFKIDGTEFFVHIYECNPLRD